MAFQIKNFSSVTASMINWLRASQRKLTDFNVGSVVRTMLEAVAAEIDELYQQMFIGIKEAIPVSVYNSFDFPAITSLPTSGLVRVTVTSSGSPILIAAATTFTPSTGAMVYLSNNDVTIAPGDTYADVLVTCTVAGTIGNIRAGISFTAAPAIIGFVSAQNLADFVSGVDAESPNDRKNRFNSFVSTLPRGTVAALEYGMQLAYLTDASGNKIERVVTSSVVEPWIADNTQPISLVNCYIHNGVGSTSSDLIARAREVIYGYYDSNNVAVPGWKAAGVRVDVFAATETTAAVTGVLTAASGYDQPTLVTQAGLVIYGYILSLGIGKPIIKAEIVQLVMEITGVADIAFSAPAGNVSAASNVKLMPGTITLT